MLLKILSGALLLVSVGLSLRHGWQGVTGRVPPEIAQTVADMGVTRPVMTVLAWSNLVVAGLLLLPATFFAGNVLNAAGILLLMAYALHAGNPTFAAIEVPFLLLPLALLWLRHPLA